MEYPAITPNDGVEIKSSWKLIHKEKTPFGCVLWLSVIAQLGESCMTGVTSCRHVMSTESHVTKVKTIVKRLPCDELRS